MTVFLDPAVPTLVSLAGLSRITQMDGTDEAFVD